MRRYVRLKYSRAIVDELYRIGTNPKVPADTRRRALMDAHAIGYGRPAVVQEVTGRDGAPMAPLVALNFANSLEGPLDPAAAYRFMVSGELEVDPDHSAFRAPRLPHAVPVREAIDAEVLPTPATAAAAPIAAHAAPAEAVDMTLLELPPETLAARDAWHAARARGER